ncbi:MAG: SprB repeat-containing protein [Bacteroidetes bacterium]|nr:SprB repeat-containing protein [Bacteroidota bacterium]
MACFGGNNGAINLSVSGGSSPYTFSWGAGVTTQNRTNLSAGNYTVTVTDASTCSSTFSTAVTQPVSGVNITPVPVSASCFGTSTGSISLTLAGGTAPYTYNWGGGVTTSARTNIPAGSYSVTVTDLNGCTAAQTTSVTQPTLLSASANQTNAGCFGASNGGYPVIRHRRYCFLQLFVE